MREHYKAMLSADGIDLGVRHAGFELPGCYRKILGQASDLHWFVALTTLLHHTDLRARSVRKYNDVTLPLVLTDADRLDVRSTTASPYSHCCAGRGAGPGARRLAWMPGVRAHVNLADGRLRALVMDFSLRSSMYATMAIREVLKCPTDPAFQVCHWRHGSVSTPRIAEVAQQIAAFLLFGNGDAQPCKRTACNSRPGCRRS